MAPGTIAYAQETINQATISGRVLDSQGAAVPGATVSVRQTDTNVTVQAITEADGRFRFPYLKIGPYELRAKLQGFKDNARTLVVERRLGVRYSDHPGSRRDRHRRDGRR